MGYRSGSDEKGRASIRDVIQWVMARGFEEDDVEKQIKNMLEFGDAMEPQRGIIQLI